MWPLARENEKTGKRREKEREKEREGEREAIMEERRSAREGRRREGVVTVMSLSMRPLLLWLLLLLLM